MDLPEISKQVSSLIETRQYASAIQLVETAIRQQGLVFPLTLQMGTALYHGGDFEKALLFLSVALEQNRNSAITHSQLAKCLAALGRKAEAMKHYLILCEGLKQRPDQVNAILMEALEVADMEAAEAELMLIDYLKAHLGEGPVFQINLIKALTQVGNFGAVQTLLTRVKFGTQTRVELRQITSVSAWADRNGGEYNKLGDREQIPVAGCDEHGNMQVAKHILSTVPYLARLPDVSVLGNSSLIFDNHGFVISDLLSHPEYGRYVHMLRDKCVLAQHKHALLVKLPDSTNEIEEAFLMSGLFSQHFGHWYAEFLPKMLCYEQHPRFKEIPLLVDEQMPGPHYDYLKAVTANPVILLPRGKRMKVRNLWIAPTTTWRPHDLRPNHRVPVLEQGALTPRSLKYLRDRVASYPIPAGEELPSRIYLCRRNRHWRFLVNEDEIVAKLSALGFDILYPEDMTFDEQVAAFRNARIVVGPNGSAFNNVIFSKPDTQILVLQSQDYDWGTGLGSLMTLGYRFHFVQGSPVSVKYSKHNSFSIDADAVLARVHEMITEGVVGV